MRQNSHGNSEQEERGEAVSRILEQARRRCRDGGRTLIEVRKKCHIDPTPHSDGCGYFRGKYCYLRVDCRVVQSKPLCWIFVIDHYSGEILLSGPCRSTPEAAKHGAAFFTKS
jgi:hypothetical protein